MGFTPEQVDQLLQPINPSRVLADGKGNAHVSQQDVTAHLIRVFGFGNWDTELLSCDVVFEDPRDGKGRFDVCYRATVRLTIKDSEGNEVCHYEDGSTGTAQNQKRGDAHDLAMKSAISLALKRCAKSLGDQFGLSLYNKGQRAALVRGTIVHPRGDEAPKDVQDGVPQQVSLGVDETAHDHGLHSDEGEPDTRPVAVDVDSLLDAMACAETTAALRALWDENRHSLGDRHAEVVDFVKVRRAQLDQPEQQALDA